MDLNRLAKKLSWKFRDIKRRLHDAFSNTYYLSVGENCLTDNILDRFKIKSFSTPYSHGRSNLDYAISLERENYCNLLNPEYLYYDFVGEKKVVRNNHYIESDNIYNKHHQKGFEFTHHDVINNESHRKSYERKVLRMTRLSKRKKIKFLYHYRNNNNRDIKLIIKKAEEFLSLYQKKGFKCEFTFFTQDIILKEEGRSTIKIHDSNNVKGYVLNTLEVWSGDDQKVFWAKKDDDLLSVMINEIK